MASQDGPLNSDRSVASPLLANAHYLLHCLHDGGLRIKLAVFHHFSRALPELLGVEDGVVPLAVVIPAQPHCDVTWISYREKNVLLAGDLRDIDGDLRTGRQNRESHERQHQPDPIESVHRLTPIVQGIEEAIPIAWNGASIADLRTRGLHPNIVAIGPTQVRKEWNL